MNKHTPGPWKCLTNGDHYVVMREGQGSRGVLLIEALTKPKAMADAMLIAAAPELLEALKKARRFVLSSNDPVGLELIEIDSAIAKATGEQP